ncbi:MAG TPA: PDZ domain-containing protein [Planctomycetota bacterium]|nr:PDZ domain-containing protein [Planctomycetota bacterium]
MTDAASGEPLSGGWYHFSVGHCGGAGHFDGSTVADTKVRIGSYDYQIGSDEHVPVRLTVEISVTQRQVERTLALQKSEAVRVTRVLPSSPAEQAGLKDGDLLVSYDGAALSNVGVLKSRSGQVPSTQKAALEVRRGGETLTLIVPGQKLGIEAENALRH